MASVKNLKKDLNYIFSELIEECYLLQTKSENSDKAELIIDKIIAAFDQLIERVNDKPSDGVKKHFQSIISELEIQVVAFKTEIDALYESEEISS